MLILILQKDHRMERGMEPQTVIMCTRGNFETSAVVAIFHPDML